MDIKTSQSINGFIATDPKLTFSEQGQARFYARVGINHYQREDDGSFTKLDPSYHDLIQFGKGAELSAERFRKGDDFLAQGYVRDYTHTVNSEQVTDQQFVTSRMSHDPNTTTYQVQRRTGSSRDTPAADRDPVARDGRTVADRPTVGASRRDQLPPPAPAHPAPAPAGQDGLSR
ncbi:single-stranded DNA-binding protein [Calidifontibacter sp. DB0510]|uniref:Single-stranded DNA-binding protein n=1 Tax=Metallococcus carri TaxID=1656884 RepID=A0A967EEP3_9MICO|nr:single-stranded DNA-binding protein [Metallococcus carri]NHN55861.1 single-stranded DNA-binding protein [Metallococcus carri]NOP38451.1 single-stranded DNA-binding protein [Calidifontibacter sp. DB2511S]